jgi:hypothetical protein
MKMGVVKRGCCGILVLTLISSMDAILTESHIDPGDLLWLFEPGRWTPVHFFPLLGGQLQQASSSLIAHAHDKRGLARVNFLESQRSQRAQPDSLLEFDARPGIYTCDRTFRLSWWYVQRYTDIYSQPYTAQEAVTGIAVAALYGCRCLPGTSSVWCVTVLDIICAGRQIGKIVVM